MIERTELNGRNVKQKTNNEWQGRNVIMKYDDRK
jgi:hypothetical protein